ncbi:MAG: hypothetical protein MZW92_39215 [Comamonadaceae bacterium]|nr:hypothetical protein [Comamonadaceae bacterium]
MLKLLTALVLSLLPAWVGAQSLERAVITHFPQPGLTADQLGVIVNDDDPDSVAIAAYYLEKRGIPAANLIHVRFKPGVSTLSREEFINLKRRVDRAHPEVHPGLCPDLGKAVPGGLHVDHVRVCIRLRSRLLRRQLQADAAQPLFQQQRGAPPTPCTRCARP